MARIKIEGFGGMRPLIEPRLLPDQLAEFCSNVVMRSGVLQPLSAPTEIYRWPGVHYPAARRLRFNDGTTAFYPLTDPDSEIIKAPLVNDGFERFYILDPPGTPLRFNTKARILAGSPSYLLGMPAPTPAPTVAHTGGAATLKVTRAYVYTYVDEYGQEGPPSDAGLHTAPTDATSWDITGMAVTVPDAAQRPVVSKKLYRTQVSDTGVATYRFVANIPLAQATYTDKILDSAVALNPALATLSAIAPPANLLGLVNMPGGFMVGWKGRDLHFSEPYKPWGWPVEYDLSLDHQIVGGAVIQQTLVVGTTGNPYTLSGNTPAAMSPSKQDRYEPCISRRSLVGGLNAVLYASANGLIAVNAGGTQDITENTIGREKWQRNYATTIYGAARSGAYYLALNDSGRGLGFMLSTADPREAVTHLVDFRGVLSLWDDSLNDDVLGNIYDGDDTVVLRFTPRDTEVTRTPRVFSWRSKEFFLAQPTNFAAMQINTSGPPLTLSPQDLVAAGVVSPPAMPAGVPVPASLLAKLGTAPPSPSQLHERLGLSSKIGMTGIGARGAFIAEAPAIGTLPPGGSSPAWFGWPWWPGVNNGEGVIPDVELTLPEGVDGVVRVFSNRVLVYRQNLRPNMQVRLPSGFRSTLWQVMVVSRVPVYSIHMATHGRELMVV